MFIFPVMLRSSLTNNFAQKQKYFSKQKKILIKTNIILLKKTEFSNFLTVVRSPGS
mgnify:CR=1 FL=1